VRLDNLRRKTVEEQGSDITVTLGFALQLDVSLTIEVKSSARSVSDCASALSTYVDALVSARRAFGLIQRVVRLPCVGPIMLLAGHGLG
jgi:hypothetical protein